MKLFLVLIFACVFFQCSGPAKIYGRWKLTNTTSTMAPVKYIFKKNGNYRYVPNKNAAKRPAIDPGRNKGKREPKGTYEVDYEKNLLILKSWNPKSLFFEIKGNQLKLYSSQEAYLQFKDDALYYHLYRKKFLF